MTPLFRPGDSLCIRAVAFGQIRPGDVVVFRRGSAAGGEVRVAHRVVRVTLGGLFTRGDRNAHTDEEPVTPVNLQGRVESLEREGRQVAVLGGLPGLLAAGIARLKRRVRRRVKVSVSAPYQILRSSGIVRLAWRPNLSAIHLETPDGPLVKFLDGRLTVARWWPESGRFECRKPYDLVIEKHPRHRREPT
jgi:hypothetical protein